VADPGRGRHGVLATPTAIYILWLTNWLVLAVSRRWRHLFVWIGVGIIVVNIGASMAKHAAATAPLRDRDPRPLGRLLDAVAADDGSERLPRQQRAYALVPAGRLPRRRAEVGGRRPARDHGRCPGSTWRRTIPPTSVAGVILGVAVSLAAFRLLTPTTSTSGARYKRGSPRPTSTSPAPGRAIVRRSRPARDRSPR
jgi:hypothetical protein